MTRLFSCSATNVKLGAVFGGRRPCRQGVPALPHVDQNHAPLLIFRASRQAQTLGRMRMVSVRLLHPTLRSVLRADEVRDDNQDSDQNGHADGRSEPGLHWITRRA
jgi:hypothetical protein